MLQILKGISTVVDVSKNRSVTGRDRWRRVGLELVNAIAEDYRKRVDWIEHRLLEMADEKGQILKVDAEAIIFQHYRCSRHSVRRYLETLEGARVISMNSTHLTVVEKQPK